MNATQESSPGLRLSGNFQASGASFLSGPSLSSVPDYYQVINVCTAVLDEKAQLKFDYFASKINIPMIKQVQADKNVTVLLSVGGEDVNFNFMDGNDKVTNFYNSLAEYYTLWGFNGVAFDICRLDAVNLPYIERAMRWFHESYPDAIISLIARATDVSPAAGGIYGAWNRMVPLINDLKDVIDWIQIKAYGYGKAFEELPKPQPVSPPLPDSIAVIPIGDSKKMLEYIFTSFVTPFIFNTPVDQEDTNSSIYGYYGFEAAKLMLGVLPAGYLGPEYYVEPEDLKLVISDIKETYKDMGGVMISSISDDAQNLYDYTRRLTSDSSEYI